MVQQNPAHNRDSTVQNQTVDYGYDIVMASLTKIEVSELFLLFRIDTPCAEALNQSFVRKLVAVIS